MCHLLYSAPGTIVPESHLINAALANQDGYGWAMVSDGALTVHKTMDADESIQTFLTARAANPQAHMLWHSRWSTGGGTDDKGNPTLAGVHPFYVGRDKLTVVAHNGYLSGARPSIGDGRSDTHKFAQSLLPGWGHLDQDGVQRKVANFCGSSNKLVILTANAAKYEKVVYLVNQSQGTWDKDSGVWHSNYDHESFRSYSRHGALSTPTSAVKGRNHYYGAWGWDEDDMVAAAAATGKSVQRYGTGDTAPEFGNPALYPGYSDDKPETNWMYVGGERVPVIRCSSCKSEDVMYGFCTECGQCQDCNKSWIDNTCDCHLPSHMRREVKDASVNKWWAGQLTGEDVYN